MDRSLSRRDLLSTTPVLLGTGILAGTPAANAWAIQPPGVEASALWPGFPRQDAALVAEVVGKSHRDEARVRELVTAHPALVNAWWDWGFGDWESPLGAASHVGHRGIAEFLLEHGARIDIFAAAMLGLTDVVKSFVAAKSGIQRNLGPHGITLLAHARAGGEHAADTLDYLVSLGDADVGHTVAPLPEDRKEVFVGKFASVDPDVRIECRVNSNGQLIVELQDAGAETPSRCNIHYLGDDEFFPSNVPSVRFRFIVEGGKAISVSVQSNEPLLTAARVDG